MGLGGKGKWRAAQAGEPKTGQGGRLGEVIRGGALIMAAGRRWCFKRINKKGPLWKQKAV